MKTLIIFLFLSSLVGCIHKRESCILTHKITTIGGCNRSGVCGVGFDDGTFGTEYFPVVGEAYCIKWKD